MFLKQTGKCRKQMEFGLLVFVFVWFEIRMRLSQKQFMVSCSECRTIQKMQSYVQWFNSFSSSDYDLKVSSQLQAVGITMDGKYNESSISLKRRRPPDKLIREHFYKHLSRPTQKSCKIAKQFGGVYVNNGVQHQIGDEIGSGMDGTKFICLDRVFMDLKSQECLVYSFGLSDDWTFEENMASLGCKIHAFDPTVNVNNVKTKHKAGIEKLSVSKLALYHESKKDVGISPEEDSEEDSSVPGFTLKDIIEHYNDTNKRITILKIDVEGEEIWSLPQILHSGVLKNINQIHIEIHVNEKLSMWSTESTHYNYLRILENLMETIQEIIVKYGFNLIYYGPNDLLERTLSQSFKYYSYFDIVMYK